jgi:hypothetical protein
MKRLRDLANRWRAEAEHLRTLEALGQAAAFEQAANDLDTQITEWELEALPVPAAAAESGYSEDYLRSLVREGVIPDGRPPDSNGGMRIQRRHLPRKPGLAGSEAATDVDFASRVAANRKEAAHG